MCGIVGAVGSRNITPILVEGLKRLEYRGYDSCGVAVLRQGQVLRARSTSRVAELQNQVTTEGLESPLGIAHTRWATHGAPAVHNAHPHFSHGPGADAANIRPGRVALVHNGIIENYEDLRRQLQARGYTFVSQTDTEVIAHLVDSLYDGDLFEAVKATVKQLHGAYAIAVFCKDEPHRVIGARAGSPLILGVQRHDDGRFEVTTHTGDVVSEVGPSWVDEHGRLFLQTPKGLGLMRSLDMDVAADAIEAGLWNPQDVVFDTLPKQCQFELNPQPA